MPVRTRIAGGLTRLAKVFGPTEPADMRAGEIAAGMTPATPFSPGEPIGPYDGFSRTPRTQNFVTGYNIAARPRSHERVAFSTLQGLIDAYDVAQACIWHRIDSIRSLDWSLVAARGHSGDLTDAIALGMTALEKPDRDLPFDSWLAAYLYDVLAYDAGTLYRMRNRAGRAIGLRTVDGTTIAPLLDYWGNPPRDPAEAYVQYVNGLPWNWLTRRDLIYTPFRKVPGSPYGKAPLETILLNANTDLRFQAYFLQTFTEGNIPGAFASAPESWTPDQIEAFQAKWDAWLLGDQAAKAQIKWLPGGSKLEFTGRHDFTDQFSLFLMRKTCAAYHVVPQDLGFTESVNRSTGESQADVQHRVGDLPLIRHVQGILTSFLQNDLGLPLQFLFDLGEEQADRLQQAQADKIYVDMGAIGPSDVREMRYGLAEPEGRPVPRFVFTERSGPIPLSALYAVAGQVDPETGAPASGAPLPHEVFGGTEGVLPNPPIKVMSLAERMYGPGAMPPAPPPQPVLQAPEAEAPGQDAGVTKDTTPGITAQTGIAGHDLVGRHPDDSSEGEAPQRQDPENLAKAEMAAYRRSIRQAKRPGRRWRDFQFTAVDAATARSLNQSARLTVSKAKGELAAAGLAVLAADTGRVLMLQRALTEGDPASGTWEFPGGCCEDGEQPIETARREWAEETGCLPPLGEHTGTWTSPDGVYCGFVWTVGTEQDIPIAAGRGAVSNPDDPDDDEFEAIAWWDPAQLPGNPALRPELLDSIDQVLAALNADTVQKAGEVGPKASGQSADWPGWQHDHKAAKHWEAVITAALLAALTAVQAEQLARDYAATAPASDGDDAELTAAALAWLLTQGIDIEGPLTPLVAALGTDGFLIGAASALAVVDATGIDLGDWTPGDTAAAQARLDSLDATPDIDALHAEAAATAREIAQTRLAHIARALALGVAAGHAPGRIGQAIRDALLSGAVAASIAWTELITGSGLGALFGYRKRKVATGQWVTDPRSKVCPRCLTNEQTGPVLLGQPYPSGDVAPPSHPRCACAVVAELT